MKFKKFCMLILLIIVLFSSISYANIDEDEQVDLNQIEYEVSQTSSDLSKIPSINSRAAVVIDRNSKLVLYGKEEYTIKKMASTTKIMTAIIVIENSNLYDTVTISEKAAGTGGSKLGMTAGDKITVCDLLYGLLLKSGNDAAVALAEYVGGSVEGFSDLMNKKASELNLYNTHFVTPHGLDNEEHYTTAYELALLTDYALKNETFSNLVATKNYTVTINGNPKSISNTNELLGNLNGVYGVKTGFTNGANRCLVTACKRDGLDVICVVLGADTKKFRTQDSIKLIEYVFNCYKVIDLEKLALNDFNSWKADNLNKFNIIKGTSNQVTPNLKDFEYKLYPIKKEDEQNISTYIDCDYNLYAPLAESSKVGTLNIIINKDEVLKFDIVNTMPIEKKNALNYFLELLSNYFKYLDNNSLSCYYK